MTKRKLSFAMRMLLDEEAAEEQAALKKTAEELAIQQQPAKLTAEPLFGTNVADPIKVSGKTLCSLWLHHNCVECKRESK